MLRTPALVGVLGLFRTISAANVVLVPITAADAAGLHSRDTSPQVTLLDQESVLWGQSSNGSSFVVNVTLATGQDEMVISMDGFSQALKNVTCDSDLGLTFNDVATYSEAVREWDWVNGNNKRSLVMVVNYPGCGQVEARQPWAISAAKYNNATFTIDFTASQQNWTDIQDSLMVEWGPSTGSSLSKRDSPHPVSIASSFPSTLYTYSASGLDFTLGCNDCGSKGNIDFSGSVNPNPFDFKASVTVQPSDIEFDLDLTFDISGELASPKSDSKKFFSVPIDGFEVLDVLQIGPSLDFFVGYTFQGVQGSASIGKKITADISNSAIAEIDLTDLGSSSNKFTGWDPTFTVGDWDLNAEIDVGLELYAKASLDFTVKVLSYGGGVGLELKIPDVNLELDTKFDSKGSVCPGTDDVFGVDFSGNIGVDLDFAASLGSKTTTINLLSKTITTLPTFCTGFSTAPKSFSVSGYTPAATTSSVVKTASTTQPTPVKTSSSSSIHSTGVTNSAHVLTTSSSKPANSTTTKPLNPSQPTFTTTAAGNHSHTTAAPSLGPCSLVTSTMSSGQVAKDCLCGQVPGATATMTGPRGVIYERCVSNGTHHHHHGHGVGTVFTTIAPTSTIYEY